MATQPAGPIFIVGAMGSGTTLLRLILDSHENIAIAQETGIARALLASEWIPFDQFGGEWYERIGLSRDELESELGQFYGGLFARFATGRGAARWGDKTPFHTWHIPLLARVFPDAVFVGIARHPGAVAASVHRRMRWPWRKSMWHWTRATNVMTYEGSLLGERFLLVRYEDLVTEPEVLLRQLLDRLGERWSDRVLDFHRVHTDRGTPTEVEGHTRSDQPLDPGRAAAWTSGLTPERRARLERRRTAALIALLGYELDQPHPARSLAEVPGNAMVLDGAGLARLVAAHPEVNWEKRPKPALANRPLRNQEFVRLRRRAGARRRPDWFERIGDRAGAVLRKTGRRLPPGARAWVRSLLQTARR